MTVVGVDGCKTGWFFVSIGGVSAGWGVSRTIEDLFHHHQTADLILIDVPIGLRDEGKEERVCDRAARALLGDRRSSVFPAPSRAALSAGSYEEGSRVNEAMTGRRLTKQSWAIVPKIREVDAFLRTEVRARGTVREVHPEVCWYGLNARVPMSHHKRKPEGVAERRELLAKCYPGAIALLSEIGDVRSQGASVDDVLDALVAAVTGILKTITLPETPERDSHGLPMEMVFADMSPSLFS